MRKILIVDDTAINRTMLKEMLGADYQIIEAADGEEALDILDREYRTISAVLLDIVLPGIDGYGVLACIRADRRFSGMPVIMITASTDERTRVKSLKLNANDFLMKPYSAEILKHCLANNIALSEADDSLKGREAKRVRRAPRTTSISFKTAVAILCTASLATALCIQHFIVQRDLRKTCENVALEFSEIMASYRHSFELFELLLQDKIRTAADADEIETYLKTSDKKLMAVEGGDYDGVYMYHKGRYLYSWDTPYSAYSATGYDATKRPWYIGAVAAKGEIFFSTPYPSYANDYMLATISRLQEDGETVIAYDIKLGVISEFVDRLNLYSRALALICDADGNIIGSTDHLYMGGNYNASEDELSKRTEDARLAAENAGIKNETAATALRSAQAQQEFIAKSGDCLADLLAHQGMLRYSLKNLSFGYVYAYGGYTCFVVTPMATLLPQTAILWAALLFASTLATLLSYKMLRKNRQILSDVLTGLNNRRAFVKYCDNHILHHAYESFGLLMLDLNHFKKINDMYGHSEGDRALLDTAAVLKAACGASQDNYFLCRYGGDEFLLAARVPDVAALERMSALISEGFRRKNQTTMTPYILEASIGEACGICPDRKSLEQLLAQADQAMYAEKRKVEGSDVF